jgi:hypothetical protein
LQQSNAVLQESKQEASALELERPQTYGGKSTKEQDLLMTAARLTLVNMGAALLQQQSAAETMMQEAGRKCLDAAQVLTLLALLVHKCKY